MNPLVEKIFDAQADAILLSPFENSGGYGRIEDVDIPLIECAEYMEASPLARAEWMRFYGMLYGREREADSLFAVVDSSYHALCQQAREAGKGRSVLVDKQTGSVWYVPGGRSTIGQMLVDAGADYAFAGDDHSGSLALPFETVLERAGESQVWLFRYDSTRPITLSQLLGEQPGYRQLRPVREQTSAFGRQPSDSSDGKGQGIGRIYGCNVMTSMFYEETPFRPDLLLQDFIQIIHPDIPNLPPLRYYHKVE
jgi:iron complex transport system substrate-binding protein